MQDWSCGIRKSGQSIAVVPTMGFLHEGHLSLVDIAREQADLVVMTIFINPTQFGPDEDLDRYPRDFDRDCKLCKERKVAVVFAPEAEEMYPADSSTWVTEIPLSSSLCGTSRPDHFRGITTIVTKLFNAVLPDIAVFGEKDFQQAQVIKRMVRDLNIPVKIVTGPLIREADGLALSSRNKYLSVAERQQALSINQALQEAREKIDAGEWDAQIIRDLIELRISQNEGKIDYIAIVDAKDLSEIKEIAGRVLIAIAAVFGKTRLIDNIVVEK